MQTGRVPATSTMMMVRFNLAPVTFVMEWLRSTFFSFLIPSGVISNAQANTIASGKPRIRKNASMELTQPRQVQCRPHDFTGLHDQPANDDVGGCDLKDIAAA